MIFLDFALTHPVNAFCIIVTPPSPHPEVFHEGFLPISKSEGNFGFGHIY